MFEDDSYEIEDQQLLNEDLEKQIDAELENSPDYEYSAHKIFKIDENMPEELKKQLESFNQDSIAMNELRSKMKNKDVQIVSSDFEDDYEEDFSDIDDLVEDDEEIGNLF